MGKFSKADKSNPDFNGGIQAVLRGYKSGD